MIDDQPMHVAACARCASQSDARCAEVSIERGDSGGTYKKNRECESSDARVPFRAALALFTTPPHV